MKNRRTPGCNSNRNGSRAMLFFALILLWNIPTGTTIFSFPALAATPVQQADTLSGKADYADSISSGMQFRLFQPRGDYFSIQLPEQWMITENDRLATDERYSFEVCLPDTRPQHFSLFELSWFADTHQTPEKFLFELNQAPQQHGDRLSEPEPRMLASQPTTYIELETKRVPVVTDDEVPVRILKRYFIIPADRGFFTLIFEQPTDHPTLGDALIRQIVESFHPEVLSSREALFTKEITDEEYQLLTHIFSPDLLSNAPLPSDLQAALRARRIVGITTVAHPLSRTELNNLQKLFGSQFSPLYLSYREKNRNEYLIREKIMVPGLSILSLNRFIRIKTGQPIGPVTAFPEEYVSLSRPGFNENHDQALLHLSWSGSLSASFFVLMQKKGSQWEIAATAADERIMYRK